MRIFLTISAGGNNSVSNSQTWLRNLYEPLLDLNYEVYLLRIDILSEKYKIPRGSNTFKSFFSQKLLETYNNEHQKKPFDYFISYLENSDVDDNCIDEIKKLGVPTLNFSCNNIHQFYLVDEISKHFDYNLHAEKYAHEKFLSIGAKPIWFQMAANPSHYHPINFEKSLDVSFVGARYAKRGRYIYQLLENNIGVQVFGPGWIINEKISYLREIKNATRRAKTYADAYLSKSLQKRAQISANIASSEFNKYMIAKYENHFHAPITDIQMIETYSKSKINLGFLEVYDNHDESATTLQHMHLREFEVPMSGGLYITNYSEELAEHYEPDKEVIVFRNEFEFLDKIKYFLSHPLKAEEIRLAGLNRALRCHTYQKRFADLFDQIKNV